MLAIAEVDVLAQLRADNPWWQPGFRPEGPSFSSPRRTFAKRVRDLVSSPVRRPVVLPGARRVGKTTLLHQLSGESSERFLAVFYVALDTPTYTGLSLDRLLALFEKSKSHNPRGRRLAVFDEVQYLQDWQAHYNDFRIQSS